jgi:hypothetical protein
LRALGLVVLVLVVARPVLGCPCSDDAGSAASLTRRDERYAVSIVGSSRHALGRFDAQGEYHALAENEAETSEELLLRAGARVTPRWEWLAELGAASYRLHAGRVVVREDGLGDGTLRSRYELWDEAMPHEPAPWPALALAALLRAPLASGASGRTRSFGSGGAQLGLGAWELGAGFDLSRSLPGALPLSLGLAVEAAYRFEDRALGVARRLGPRLDSSLYARAEASRVWSATVGLRLRAAGDVTYAGEELPGTGERLLSLLWGAGFFDAASGLRTSLTVALDPPLEVFSSSATAAAALGVTLAYGSN